MAAEDKGISMLCVQNTECCLLCQQHSDFFDDWWASTSFSSWRLFINQQSGGCVRRFQVSTDSKRSKEKQPIKIRNKESLGIDTSATDIQLIRNWHLETVSWTYIIASFWWYNHGFRKCADFDKHLKRRDHAVISSFEVLVEIRCGYSTSIVYWASCWLDCTQLRLFMLVCTRLCSCSFVFTRFCMSTMVLLVARQVLIDRAEVSR